MRYRSKPSEVEAVQWTGDNLEVVESFGVKFRYRCGYDNPLRIKAGKNGAQDYVPVPLGHWVVRQPGDLSDHCPVDPDYFANKYEPVGEQHGPRAACPECGMGGDVGADTPNPIPF